ncbi:MAG: alpha/beta hydrolase [Phycisphaerae bacterium]
MNTRVVIIAMLLSVSLLLAMGGCGKYDLNSRYVSQERADRGMVVILPGIEGESKANRDIREGLYRAGIPYGLVIYRWGAPIPGPGGMLVNQTDVSRDRRMAEELAEQITQYQQKHPGKPVFLIGHSAGGGITVFTMEALGKVAGARPVEGSFLLSASISSDYDLAPALAMSRRGLVNVSNRDDQLLNSGTATFGNVDGKKGDSAGRTGFYRKYPNVFERPITNEQVRREFGIIGPAHFMATHEQLIEKYAPAWILSESWPPARPGAKP